MPLELTLAMGGAGGEFLPPLEAPQGAGSRLTAAAETLGNHMNGRRCEGWVGHLAQRWALSHRFGMRQVVATRVCGTPGLAPGLLTPHRTRNGVALPRERHSPF